MKEGIKKDLPETHKAVLSVLPKGRFNAITTVEIMARTGLKDKRVVSEIIRELVVKYDQPIATSSTVAFKGVFIVQDIIDYQIGKGTIKSRANSMLERDSAYTEACLQIFKGMVTLDESKERRVNRSNGEVKEM